MEGNTVNEVKLELKLIVDSKAKKVVFAEAGNDFVDFLIHMLSLPLATGLKLLDTSNEETIGSLPALFKSVKSLSTKYFEPNVNKDTVFVPKLPVTQPLLPLNYTPDSITYYKCSDHNYGSCRSGAFCPHSCYDSICRRTINCKKPMQEVKLTYVAPTSENGIPGFVKLGVPFMVMDNLEVKPMSITLIKSLVNDFDYFVEQDVKFGPKEALTLLRAAFTANNEVLTTVFLGIKKEDPYSSVN
ncbi:hypothetical protein RND81_10G138700 [Saponaria officinalis]|uniref:DUF674 family protein n=1 Tax=Saponaria officinalis TaxID=3572 RepID=A0AAW1I4B4_SAPOF